MDIPPSWPTVGCTVAPIVETLSPATNLRLALRNAASTPM